MPSILAVMVSTSFNRTRHNAALSLDHSNTIIPFGVLGPCCDGPKIIARRRLLRLPSAFLVGLSHKEVQTRLLEKGSVSIDRRGVENDIVDTALIIAYRTPEGKHCKPHHG